MVSTLVRTSNSGHVPFEIDGSCVTSLSFESDAHLFDHKYLLGCSLLSIGAKQKFKYLCN